MRRPCIAPRCLRLAAAGSVRCTTHRRLRAKDRKAQGYTDPSPGVGMFDVVELDRAPESYLDLMAAAEAGKMACFFEGPDAWAIHVYPVRRKAQRIIDEMWDEPTWPAHLLARYVTQARQLMAQAGMSLYA